MNQGFRTGERFKLRIVSTFNGEMTSENINPRRERGQIYPQLPEHVVALVARRETLNPLGVDLQHRAMHNQLLSSRVDTQLRKLG